jgi:iron complex outermembrane receptor protein
VFGLLLGASAAPAAAQSSGQKKPPDLTELSLEALSRVELVRAASGYDQKPADAPSSVTIVTGEEIRKYGHRTLADVLRSIRGFQVTYDRNYSYVGLRGFGRLGDYNTRVLLLIDGHRINDTVFDDAGIGTEGILDVDLIQRVEIIRGPSSSLYGTNAFLAVINVVTKHGRDLKGLHVAFSPASFSTAAGSVTYGQAFSNGIEVVASGMAYHSGGQDLYYPEFDTPATNHGVAAGADFDRAKRLFGNITYKDLSVEAAFVTRDKGIPTASFDTVFGDSRTQTVDARAYANVKYGANLSPQIQLVARGSYDQSNYHGTYVYNDSAADAGDSRPIVSTESASGRWGGAEVQLLTRSLAHHRLIGGAEVRYNGQQDQMVSNETAVHLDDRRSSSLWAIYGQEELTVSPSVKINAGLRYDHYSTFGGTANPRLALLYNPSEETSVKLLYGRAFRAPNAYELFYRDGYSTKASLVLKPETIQTIELAAERQVIPSVRLKVSLYDYKIDNLISLQVDPADGMLVYGNNQWAKARGAEMALTGSWVSGLRGSVNYAYQHETDMLSGSTPPNSPVHLVKANLLAPIGWKLFAGCELQYTSRRKTLGEVYARGFIVGNITVSRRVHTDRMEIAFSVYNVTNQRYADPGSEEHVQRLIPQDGRNVRLTVRYRF